MNSKLYGKTIIWNGDSICAGNPIRGCWASRIGERNKMVWKNYAVGGGTVTENSPVFKSGLPRHSVSATLEQMYAEFPEADYVSIEGGTNDADLLGNPLLAPEGTRLGSFSPADYSGEYDRDTFCGALESVFYRAGKYWMGKKIGYIVAQKMGMNPDSRENRRRYFDEAVKICIKWGIPYLDLWHGCYLNPQLPWMYDSTKSAAENHAENTGMYADGQHLTSRGYDVTSDIIESWLNTL